MYIICVYLSIPKHRGHSVNEKERPPIENTPDEGRVEVSVKNKKSGVELLVQDAGIGIVEEHRKRIFEGFFPTQETSNYSSKKPYDFNAGGKGADLLRLKIFSERYNFKFDMSSERCRYMPLSSDLCPGNISHCHFCYSAKDCITSGGTVFKAVFQLYDSKNIEENFKT
jgi:hypothetical protein